MKTTLARTVATTIALCAASTFAAPAPKGWFTAGSHPGEYAMTIDRAVAHGGQGSASLKSTAPKTSGFGTLMQTFSADMFHGKRVRLSGYVRANEVSDWAGLWMRVDGPRGEPLGFDNMQDRAVKGTSEWTKYAVVLDVPETAEAIAFGLLLTGRGQVWMDDLKFEVVSKDVPTTGPKKARTLPAAPANLNFEE